MLDQIIFGSMEFEIRSNIGQYSLLIYEKLGPADKRVCVEPGSNNYAMLQYNGGIHKCKNITLVHKAVSDQDGSMILYKDTITSGRKNSIIPVHSSSQNIEELKMSM